MINMYRYPCKVALFCQVLITLDFRDRFSKNTPLSKFVNVCPVGAKLFHADGWTVRLTDVTKLIQWNL
jgi:hypothetical protein